MFWICFRFVIAQTLRKHQLDRATIRLPINITSIALPNLNQPPWLVWWYKEIIKINSHIKTKQGFISWLESLKKMNTEQPAVDFFTYLCWLGYNEGFSANFSILGQCAVLGRYAILVNVQYPGKWGIFSKLQSLN